MYFQIAAALKHRLHDRAAILTPSPIVRPQEFAQSRFSSKNGNPETTDQASCFDPDLLRLLAVEYLPYRNLQRQRVVLRLQLFKLRCDFPHAPPQISVGDLKAPHRPKVLFMVVQSSFSIISRQLCQPRLELMELLCQPAPLGIGHLTIAV